MEQDMCEFLTVEIMYHLPLVDMSRCANVCQKWRTLVRTQIGAHPEVVSMYESQSKMMDVCYKIGLSKSDDLVHVAFMNNLMAIPILRTQMVLGATEARSRSALSYLLALSDDVEEDTMQAFQSCVIRGDTKMAEWLMSRVDLPRDRLNDMLLLEAKIVCNGPNGMNRPGRRMFLDIIPMIEAFEPTAINMYIAHKRTDILDKMAQMIESSGFPESLVIWSRDIDMSELERVSPKLWLIFDNNSMSIFQ